MAREKVSPQHCPCDKIFNAAHLTVNGTDSITFEQQASTIDLENGGEDSAADITWGMAA